MINADRSSVIRSIFIMLAAAVLVGTAACTPSAGSLGTPAAPAATANASADAGASDALPSQALPSLVPSTEPSAAPSASVEPSSGASIPATTSTAATRAPTSTPTPAPAGISIVRAYFILGSFTDNPGLVPVLRTIPQTKAVARAAMVALLAGPKGAELEASPAMYTGIPEGTRLLGLTIADKVATVNLSKDFLKAKANFQASWANAQVVYTLTQFPTVKFVRIDVEGSATYGPFDRSDFRMIGLLPAIFVDRPAWGAAAGNPARIAGIANVFEATFRAQILDAKGKVLADEQVMASCGTGCWGTFKKDLAYTVAKGQYGTLRVFNLSAKDGNPENVTEYRVWLTPKG